MSDAPKPVFNPRPAERGLGYRFQIQNFSMEGQLAIEAANAAERFGLSRPAFVRECIKFALSYMEKTQ